MTTPRSGPTITIGDLEIEAIEKVIVRVENVGGAIVGVALKEPVAVIVRSPAGTWRVDLEHLDRGAVMNDPPPVDGAVSHQMMRHLVRTRSTTNATVSRRSRA